MPAACDDITAVIDELNASRTSCGDDGQVLSIDAFAISRRAGERLEAAVRSIMAESAVEIGCASGLSTLYLGRGLRAASSDRPCLHVMDPRQSTHWKNIGRLALRRAGIDEQVRFYEEPAHAVLPRLAEQGLAIQFAFIDGWHMLDHVMLEAFYCDLLLEPGGLLALHDLWMPALQHFSSFWHGNRPYEPVRWDPQGGLQSQPPPGDCVPPSLRHGSPYFVRAIAPFVQEGVLLLRKCGADQRRWDEFHDYLT